MNVMMNSVMKTLFTEVDSGGMMATANLSSDLLRLVEPGFAMVDGAVLLKACEGYKAG
jgi:hypothetical protein